MHCPSQPCPQVSPEYVYLDPSSSRCSSSETWESEAQRGHIPGPWSHSSQVEELGLKPGAEIPLYRSLEPVL